MANRNAGVRPRRGLARSLARSPTALFGLAVIAALCLGATLAPWLAPADPAAQSLAERLAPPSTAHPFGLDSLGRDILARILYGARISLYVAILATLVSVTAGVSLGALAGYAGGWVDEAIMRVVDVLLAFPGILLAIALAAVLGPGVNNVILALCAMGWVGYTRLVRAQVLVVRELEYVEAARALGARPARILFRHILPSVMAPVLVQASFGMAGTIIAEAGLSFLGIGVQPPTPSWGSMLDEGRMYLQSAAHLTAFPGIAIMLTVLGFNFLGDALRDALDVKQA